MVNFRLSDGFSAAPREISANFLQIPGKRPFFLQKHVYSMGKQVLIRVVEREYLKFIYNVGNDKVRRLFSFGLTVSCRPYPSIQAPFFRRGLFFALRSR